MAAGGGSKRRYQDCSDYLGTIIYFRALQGHSGSNLIDPTLQDNVLIGPGIFPYIYHVGRQFQSLFNYQQWIGTWRSEFEQKTKRFSSCLLIQEIKDTETLNIWTSLYHVLARYMHSAWKRHQDAVFWVDIDLAIKGGINILSNEIECNYSSRNTSSLLY